MQKGQPSKGLPLIKPFFILEDTAYGKYILICNRRCEFNAGSRGAGMYNRIVSYIDAHMSAVADNIARLCLRQTYAVACAPQCAGTVRKAYSEVRIDAHDKSGTVRSVGQAGAAVYVRVADELRRETCNGITGGASCPVSDN